MKFAFIRAEKAFFKVAVLCRLLGVTRQGYYAFEKRRRGPRVRCDELLRERIRRLHAESRGTYGSPRVHAALRNEGLRVGKGRVERVLRSLGLQGRTPRRWRATTRANPKHAVVGNSLDRDFTASRPNERWVTDISYVWTDEGWCYLAVILDLYSRSVVGWALDTTLTTKLALAALDMAIRRRRPSAGLLHHSDRGCQYTSDEYRSALADLGVSVSMSRKGNCWDNAVAESFFSSLKKERVKKHIYRTRALALVDVADYIDAFYNGTRRHSHLGGLSPDVFEATQKVQRRGVH
jgi:transposase InsO family protein